MTYWTSNKMIPLNDREPGEIAPIAWQQLRRFENAADTWPLVDHRHHSDTHAPQMGKCCRICDKTVFFTQDPQGVVYEYTVAQMRALVVAHIRQCHEAIITENGEIDEDSGKREVLDVAGDADSNSKCRGDANRLGYQGSDSRGIEYT